MSDYSTLKKLRNGEVVDLDGILFKMDEGEIELGDLYIAERNSGPKFLEAKEIDVERGYIIPTTPDYVFSFSECVKVCEVIIETKEEKWLRKR